MQVRPLYELFTTKHDRKVVFNALKLGRNLKVASFEISQLVTDGAKYGLAYFGDEDESGKVQGLKVEDIVTESKIKSLSEATGVSELSLKQTYFCAFANKGIAKADGVDSVRPYTCGSVDELDVLGKHYFGSAWEELCGVSQRKITYEHDEDRGVSWCTEANCIFDNPFPYPELLSGLTENEICRTFHSAYLACVMAGRTFTKSIKGSLASYLKGDASGISEADRNKLEDMFYAYLYLFRSEFVCGNSLDVSVLGKSITERDDSQVAGIRLGRYCRQGVKYKDKSISRPFQYVRAIKQVESVSFREFVIEYTRKCNLYEAYGKLIDIVTSNKYIDKYPVICVDEEFREFLIKEIYVPYIKNGKLENCLVESLPNTRKRGYAVGYCGVNIYADELKYNLERVFNHKTMWKYVFPVTVVPRKEIFVDEGKPADSRYGRVVSSLIAPGNMRGIPRGVTRAEYINELITTRYYALLACSCYENDDIEWSGDKKWEEISLLVTDSCCVSPLLAMGIKVSFAFRGKNADSTLELLVTSEQDKEYIEQCAQKAGAVIDGEKNKITVLAGTTSDFSDVLCGSDTLTAQELKVELLRYFLLMNIIGYNSDFSWGYFYIKDLPICKEIGCAGAEDDGQWLFRESDNGASGFSLTRMHMDASLMDMRYWAQSSEIRTSGCNENAGIHHYYIFNCKTGVTVRKKPDSHTLNCKTGEVMGEESCEQGKLTYKELDGCVVCNLVGVKRYGDDRAALPVHKASVRPRRTG